MSIFKAINQAYQSNGLYGIRLLILKRYFVKKSRPIKDFNKYIKYFKGKNGIEIGGMSNIFSNELPIYPIVKNMDGCNFSATTVWEGTIKEGENYNFFKSEVGYQYIYEASDLGKIPNEKYDFIVSSHCLEHCANTFKVIKEWLRVIKKGGAILLILPDRKFTFDHKRPITEFDHLLKDFNDNVDENDLTHLPEILKLHDLEMDKKAVSIEKFEKRSLDNFNNRCLHHHVFDFDLLKKIFEYHNIETVNVSFAKPYHQIILGVKK